MYRLTSAIANAPYRCGLPTVLVFLLFIYLFYPFGPKRIIIIIILLIIFINYKFSYFFGVRRQESSFATFCAEATGKRSARTSTPRETWIRQLQQINKVMTTAGPAMIIWRG